MNYKRVAGGGLVSGIVLNLGEFLMEPVLGPRWEQTLARLGLSAPGESAMMGLVIMTLLLGILSIWLYAAIVPRFGAGGRTAVLTGVITWLLSCGLPNVAMLSFGIIDAQLFWLVTLWPVVQTVIATVAGARIYREDRVVVAAAVPA